MTDPNILRRLLDLERAYEQTRTKEVPFKGIGCRVYNNANISIPNNPTTAQGTLTFDAERDDSTGMHSTSVNTSRITIAVAGAYDVGCCVRFASNATGYRQVFLFKNGTNVILQDTRNAVNGAVTIITIHTRYIFTAGDYIEAVVFQNSGGALNVDAAADYSPEFWAHFQP